MKWMWPVISSVVTAAVGSRHTLAYLWRCISGDDLSSKDDFFPPCPPLICLLSSLADLFYEMCRACSFYNIFVSLFGRDHKPSFTVGSVPIYSAKARIAHRYHVCATFCRLWTGLASIHVSVSMTIKCRLVAAVFAFSKLTLTIFEDSQPYIKRSHWMKLLG